MKTILAVDDSPSIRQLVTHTLKDAGYAVIEAANGVEGLAKAKGSQVQLVLTDQNMPQMDGMTMIKNIRGLVQHRSTPILVLTTETSDAMKAQGKAAGATGWLVKPFDPVKLVAVVQKLIG
ncbi:MAG: response regulator [Pseudomonadota bacterium]|nr:response regulator [Pseudomonadota bacterium]